VGPIAFERRLNSASPVTEAAKVAESASGRLARRAAASGPQGRHRYPRDEHRGSIGRQPRAPDPIHEDQADAKHNRKGCPHRSQW
jgi:hypothetical protein